MTEEPVEVSDLILPPREQKTLLKEVYRRVKRLAKELWISDIAIAMVCLQCGEGVKQQGDVLLCKCRERHVR